MWESSESISMATLFFSISSYLSPNTFQQLPFTKSLHENLYHKHAFVCFISKQCSGKSIHQFTKVTKRRWRKRSSPVIYWVGRKFICSYYDHWEHRPARPKISPVQTKKPRLGARWRLRNYSCGDSRSEVYRSTRSVKFIVSHKLSSYLHALIHLAELCLSMRYENDYTRFQLHKTVYRDSQLPRSYDDEIQYRYITVTPFVL